MRLAVALALVTAAGCSGAGEPAAPRTATVARIGDGDTLELRSGERVRLLQIDAPELGEGECYAHEALRALERLVPAGSSVSLQPDHERDGYGRLLRYVSARGLVVNVELVRQGAATPYFRRGEEGLHADELLDAVEDARRANRGLWSACRVSWQPDRLLTTRPR